MPEPVAILSTAKSVSTLTSLAETELRYAVALTPGEASLIVPLLPLVVNVVPEYVYAPPVSALPQRVTVRPKLSAAIGPAGAAATVTDLVIASVAPWLSVTVSLTLYVPADA